jgi:plastocyanin
MAFRSLVLSSALAVSASAMLGISLGAQGAVSGQVAIQEKAGDPSEDLGNTVVYLEPVAATSRKVSATNTSIALQAREFRPRVRIVTEGSKVEFPNQDPWTHNVFTKAPQGPFDTESYGKGKVRENTFRSAGVYPLYCNVHPKMTAFVVAVKTPYFTQAGNDGRFNIDKVPAGSYKLHVWHDRGGEQVSDLIVPTAGLKDLKYQLDARGFKFVQHKNKFGKDYQFNGDIY